MNAPTNTAGATTTSTMESSSVPVNGSAINTGMHPVMMEAGQIPMQQTYVPPAYTGGVPATTTIGAMPTANAIPGKGYSSVPEEGLGGLRKLHIALIVIYIIQGCVILVLGAILARYPIQMITAFSGFDVEQTLYINGTQSANYFHPGGYICLIFFVSALFHIFAIIWWKRHLRALETTRCNKLRWFDYSLTYAWMIFIVSFVAGVREVLLLMGILGLTASFCYLWMGMEIANPPNMPRASYDWTLHIVGWVPFCFLVIIMYSYVNSFPFRGSTPNFNFATVVLVLAFVSIHGLLQFCHFKAWGRLRYLLAYERGHMILNLLINTVMSWFLFGCLVSLFYSRLNSEANDAAA